MTSTASRCVHVCQYVENKLMDKQALWFSLKMVVVIVQMVRSDKHGRMLKQGTSV